MTTRWDPDKHPRGPLGRFVDVAQIAPSGRRPSTRFRESQQSVRDWRPGDLPDSKAMEGAYRRGSLWAGTPIGDMSPRHVEEAETYQTASDINGVLRRHSSGRWAMNDRQRERIQVMDEVVEANRLKNDTTVYRGVGQGNKPSPLADAQPGDQIRDPGYSSTSVDFGVAADFGTDVMEIELPAGTHVAPVSRLNAGQFGEQRELVVGRGAVFEIDSIEQTDRPGFFNNRAPVRIIRARLVGYLED